MQTAQSYGNHGVQKIRNLSFLHQTKSARFMSHVCFNFYFAVKFLFGVHPPHALDRDRLFNLSRSQEGPKQSKSQAVRSQAQG